MHLPFRSRTLPVVVTWIGVLVVTAVPAFAKRSAPKPVPPVTANNVEYSAPHEFMGFVVATDLRAHQELWRQRIYQWRIDPALERDVQDVFITSLALASGTLMVTNERGETYALDLATRNVTRREGRAPAEAPPGDLVELASGERYSKTAYESGRAEALQDARENRLIIEIYGLPGLADAEYAGILEHNFHIHLKSVAGCVVDDKIIGHAKGYNEVSEAEMKRRFGRDVLAKAQDEAAKQVEKRTRPGK